MKMPTASTFLSCRSLARSCKFSAKSYICPYLPPSGDRIRIEYARQVSFTACLFHQLGGADPSVCEGVAAASNIR